MCARVRPSFPYYKGGITDKLDQNTGKSVHMCPKMLLFEFLEVT